MKSNRRISFAVMFVMVVSAFAFVPAVSAEASVSISITGYNNGLEPESGWFYYGEIGPRSFASVNGTATYIVLVNNDGTVDFTDATLRASFDDSSWQNDNVSMEYDTLNGTGLIDIPALNQGDTAKIFVNVSVGDGANVAEQTISMDLIFNSGSTDIDFEGPDALITVTDWVAFTTRDDSAPDTPDTETYSNGDEYHYNISIHNIKVDNASVNQPTDDVIRLSLPTNGWSVRSYDHNFSNASGELVLEGMSSGESYGFSFVINLTGNPAAGNHELAFFAMSGGGGGGMMGGDPPYYQPNGLLAFPVIVAPNYGVSVTGSGSQSVDVSDADAIATWRIEVRNLGNVPDTFSLVWTVGGVPLDWTLTALPEITNVIQPGKKEVHDVGLTVPGGANATIFDSTSMAEFSLVATSSGDSTSSPSQVFTVTVNQHYGVSLSVDNDTKSGAPEKSIDFIFSLSNTGNGEDTFSIAVSGSSAWLTNLSKTSILIPAVSTSQVVLGVTIPANKNAGASSDFVITAISSGDANITTNYTVKVITSQVFDIAINHGSGDGIVKVSQAAPLQLLLNITNNGNGKDLLTFALGEEAPTWASLGSSEGQVLPGSSITLIVTLSPTTEDLSGKDYIFDVVVTSSNGNEWTSPQMTATIEVKETSGEEVVVEELEEEEDTPGFGAIISLISLTLVVLSRRKE